MQGTGERKKKQIFNHVSLYKNTNFLFCYIIVKLVWFIRLQIRYMCGKSMTNNNGMKIKKQQPQNNAHTLPEPPSAQTHANKTGATGGGGANAVLSKRGDKNKPMKRHGG